MHQLVAKGLSLVLVCTLVLGQTAPLLAGPQDGKVVAGSATIRQESPTKVGITQTSDRVAINWQSFNIGAAEHVQFYQPSASSVALNRVVGPDPSVIMGKLTANGQVFLVNPNGIVFGKGSQVDVSGLMATTHNIKNENFMAGNYLFNIPGKPGASVINEGLIRVADTGVAAFVAPSVANRGIVVAKLGKVALASANGFTLDFYGDELLSFLVSDEVAKTAFDLQGNQLTSFVENSGRIEAQGGHVLLTAKAAEGVVHSVINQSGVIEATTVGQDKGEIILQGGKHGAVKVRGTLDASAPNGGDGGFIDTSGAKVTIDPTTKITTDAPFGQTGRWLLDPTNFTIAANGDLSPADLAYYLGLNNVDIQTMLAGAEQGNVYVNEAVSWDSMNKLTLLAHNNIYINAPVTASGGASMRLRADSDAYGGGTVVFGAGGHVTMNGGTLGIYYNPVSYVDANTKSDSNSNPYISNVTLNGSSEMKAYMLISDVFQLQDMRQNLSGVYALGGDVDASQTQLWNLGAGFEPIGTEAVPWRGTLYGDGRKVTDIFINRPTSFSVGLIGGSEGTVSTIVMQGGVVRGLDQVGSVVGINKGLVTNAYANGVSVEGVLGAIVAVGGLVGYNSGTIRNSASTGSVDGGVGIGGLVGGNGVIGSVSNSYSTGVVSGGDFVGGLVGYNWGIISNCFSAASISSGGLNTGGLVGHNFGWVVSNSYWDTLSSGTAISAGGVGRTTAQMKQQANYSGWDFENVWSIQEGLSYPTLRWVTASPVTLVNPQRRATTTNDPTENTNTPGGDIGGGEQISQADIILYGLMVSAFDVTPDQAESKFKEYVIEKGLDYNTSKSLMALHSVTMMLCSNDAIKYWFKDDKLAFTNFTKLMRGGFYKTVKTMIESPSLMAELKGVGAGVITDMFVKLLVKMYKDSGTLSDYPMLGAGGAYFLECIGSAASTAITTATTSSSPAVFTSTFMFVFTTEMTAKTTMQLIKVAHEVGALGDSVDKAERAYMDAAFQVLSMYNVGVKLESAVNYPNMSSEELVLINNAVRAKAEKTVGDALSNLHQLAVDYAQWQGIDVKTAEDALFQAARVKVAIDAAGGYENMAYKDQLLLEDSNVRILVSTYYPELSSVTDIWGVIKKTYY